MTEWISRAQIGLVPRDGGGVALRSVNVDGYALHWPGMAKPIDATGDAGLRRVCSALRGWQEYHMKTRGWSDIAYQAAIDQAGRKYSLRGLNIKSGANGDDDVNTRFGAVLLVLAPGEQPSAAMIATAKEVGGEFCRMYPGARRAPYGHQDVRPRNSSGGITTDCPGPIAEAAIKAGTFTPGATVPGGTPSPTEEDAMAALTKQDIQDAVAAAMQDKLSLFVTGDNNHDSQVLCWQVAAQSWSDLRMQELKAQGIPAGEAITKVKDELWPVLRPLWA
jgi:hypothetical protein